MAQFMRSASWRKPVRVSFMVVVLTTMPMGLATREHISRARIVSRTRAAERFDGRQLRWRRRRCRLEPRSTCRQPVKEAKRASRVCRMGAAMGLPEPASQRRTVRSRQAVTTFRPSGLKSPQYTQSG